MLTKRRNPVRLLSLNIFKHDFGFFTLNFLIWYNKLIEKKRNNTEKMFKPKLSINKNNKIKIDTRYETATKNLIFFLNLIAVDFKPIISSSDIS